MKRMVGRGQERGKRRKARIKHGDNLRTLRRGEEGMRTEGEKKIGAKVEFTARRTGAVDVAP